MKAKKTLNFFITGWILALFAVSVHANGPNPKTQARLATKTLFGQAPTAVEAIADELLARKLIQSTIAVPKGGLLAVGLAGPIIDMMFGTMFGFGGGVPVTEENIWNLIRERVFRSIDSKLSQDFIEDSNIDLQATVRLYTELKRDFEMSLKDNEDHDDLMRDASRLYGKLSTLEAHLALIVNKLEARSKLADIVNDNSATDVKKQTAYHSLKMYVLFSTEHLSMLNTMQTLSYLLPNDPKRTTTYNYDADIIKFNEKVFQYRDHIDTQFEDIKYWAYNMYRLKIDGSFDFELTLTDDQSWSEIRDICKQQSWGNFVFFGKDYRSIFVFESKVIDKLNPNIPGWTEQTRHNSMGGRNPMDWEDEVLDECANFALEERGKLWNKTESGNFADNKTISEDFDEYIQGAIGMSYIGDVRFEHPVIYSFEQDDSCIQVDKSHGARASLVSCDYSNKQKFIYSNTKLHLATDPSYCLTVGVSNIPIFTQTYLMAYECSDDNSVTQSWDLNSIAASTVSITNQRMAVSKSSWDNSTLNLNTHVNSVLEEWTAEAHFSDSQPVEVTFKRNGNCLDGNNTQPNSALTVNSCSGSDSQTWVFHNGLLRSKANLKMCIDIPHGNTNNGTDLVLWDCMGEGKQTWDIEWTDFSEGRIRSDLNNSNNNTLYIDRRDGGPNITLWETGNLDNQLWDIEYIPLLPKIRDFNNADLCLAVQYTEAGAQIIKSVCDDNNDLQDWLYAENSLRPKENLDMCVSYNFNEFVLSDCQQGITDLTFTGEEFYSYLDTGDGIDHIYYKPLLDTYWNFDFANHSLLAGNASDSSCYWEDISNLSLVSTYWQNLWGYLGFTLDGWESNSRQDHALWSKDWGKGTNQLSLHDIENLKSLGFNQQTWNERTCLI